MPDRLSALDATFLTIENGVSHMHIGSIAIFDGPAPEHEAAQRMVEGKLPLVPRYRQVVPSVPGGLGRPVRLDDEHRRRRSPRALRSRAATGARRG